MSSLSFLGNNTSYLTVPSSSGTNMGTGDFTIEWYQYQTDSNPYPRIFAIGTYSSTTTIGVSIESGTFYFWSNGTPRGASVGTYKNTWLHFAIVRSSNTTTVYKNGAVFISGFADSFNYTSANNMVISNETSISTNSSFGGYLAYFHVMKGFAKYTSGFQVSTTFPPVTANTTLLLTASGFSGSIGNTVVNTNVGTFALLPFVLPINLVCFKENTKILTNNGYRSIQDLRKGDLIKTICHDFLPIDMIGKKQIYHEASKIRIKDQLYKCSQTEYPEIFEDLIITGCHSILIDEFFSEEQREKTIEFNNNRVFITDNNYRLPACFDERASVYETAGTYTIYHLALENDDYYMNYGIYANGLLVETCSKRYLKEISNMILIE